MSKILSIDDSKHIRNIVRAAVEVLGHDFLEAEDGPSGLAVVEEHAGDIILILLDVNMPGMLGYEVLTKLKENELHQQIPVMMVTTESERHAIISSIKSGAANYVTKPFTQEELMTKMVESLGEIPGF